MKLADLAALRSQFFVSFFLLIFSLSLFIFFLFSFSFFFVTNCFWNGCHATPLQRPFYYQKSYHRNVILEINLPMLLFSFYQKTNLHLYEWSRLSSYLFPFADNFPTIQFQIIFSKFYLLMLLLAIISKNKRVGVPDMIATFKKNNDTAVILGRFHKLFCALFPPYAQLLRSFLLAQNLGVGRKQFIKSTPCFISVPWS